MIRMPRRSDVWTPYPDTLFGTDDVLRVVASGAGSLAEIRVSLGTKHPGYDNYWIARALAELKRLGKVRFVGRTRAGRWEAIPSSECSRCGRSLSPSRRRASRRAP